MLKLNDEEKKEIVESYKKMRGNKPDDLVGSVIMNDKESPRIYFSPSWEIVTSKQAELISGRCISYLRARAEQGKILKIRKRCRIYFLRHQCEKIRIEKEFNQYKKNVLEEKKEGKLP